MQTNWEMISFNAEKKHLRLLDKKNAILKITPQFNIGVPFGVSMFSSIECLIYMVLTAHK